MIDNSKETPRASSILKLIPSMIVVFAAAFSIPMASNLYIGMAASGISCIYLVATARKKVPVVVLLFALAGMFGLPDGLPAMTVVLSLITGTGALSWLIAYTRSPFLALISALAYGIAAAMTGDFIVSLLAISFAPAAIVLGYALIKEKSRLSALCSTAVAFVTTLLIGGTAILILSNVELSLTALRGYAQTVTESMESLILSVELQLPDGTTQKLFDERDAYNMAHQTVTLLPALSVILLNAISFFAQRLQFSLVRLTMGEERLKPSMLAFVVSPAAGIIFTISCLVFTLADSTPTGVAAATVCQNIFLMLFPALVGMGIMYFFARVSERKLRAAPIIMIGVLILAFFNYLLAFLLIACFGAYASVSIPLTAYLKSKMKDDEQ